MCDVATCYIIGCVSGACGGWWGIMRVCSTVCVMDVSRPSLSKARCVDSLDYHRVRSLRDLNPALITSRSLRDRAPRCLRHIGVPRLVKSDQSDGSDMSDEADRE
ncbi:MAG: hypothetical protein ACI4SO_00170 [Muribaculaceae bacterium]